MSEKTNQEQDQKLDENPEDLNVSLADVDQLLAEEDPEFLNQLKKIDIDPNQVDRAGVGAISLHESGSFQKTLSYFKQAFDIKTNTKSVALFWITSLFLLAALFFVWMNKTRLFSQSLFMTSYEVIGTRAKDYNPINETEAFYDNPRFAKNLVTMNPIFVNIKPSESSGENPMLVFEVTIEGLSSDAIIEIKDRQVEFKDLIARLAEEKTYDFLISTEGKRELCDQIKDLLNANLTQGQVRRVMLKNFISNPN